MWVQLLPPERPLWEWFVLQLEPLELAAAVEQEVLEVEARQWLAQWWQEVADLRCLQRRMAAHLEVAEWRAPAKAARLVLWLEERVDQLFLAAARPDHVARPVERLADRVVRPNVRLHS